MFVILSKGESDYELLRCDEYSKKLNPICYSIRTKMLKFVENMLCSTWNNFDAK